MGSLVLKNVCRRSHCALCHELFKLNCKLNLTPHFGSKTKHNNHAHSNLHTIPFERESGILNFELSEI